MKAINMAAENKTGNGDNKTAVFEKQSAIEPFSEAEIRQAEKESNDVAVFNMRSANVSARIAQQEGAYEKKEGDKA